ncbi:MAG: SCP2 sterol-binding domain-containing protein [Bacteroidales bacterium]|jgi:putative sterol carrier protein|nr:SCP2 sterol-binding domain-containing protein [Bacteroidales bacterium]
MNSELIKAHLNLYAIIKNLEDLIKYDEESAEMAKNWNITLQFKVKNGPQAYISFNNGQCTVGRGKAKKANCKLYFFSPQHLNKMFNGSGTPMILKGFTKIGFLLNDFGKITDRLEYFLKPTDELLNDDKYLALNTRLTMNTAAFSIPELGALDSIARHPASHMRNGTILMKVAEKGPSVHISFKDGQIASYIGDFSKPTAQLSFKDTKTANDFLNGKSDTFTAIATGDVLIKGQTGMLDAVSLILDRIPLYT